MLHSLRANQLPTNNLQLGKLNTVLTLPELVSTIGGIGGSVTVRAPPWFISSVAQSAKKLARTTLSIPTRADTHRPDTHSLVLLMQ